MTRIIQDQAPDQPDTVLGYWLNAHDAYQLVCAGPPALIVVHPALKCDMWSIMVDGVFLKRDGRQFETNSHHEAIDAAEVERVRWWAERVGTHAVAVLRDGAALAGNDDATLRRHLADDGCSTAKWLDAIRHLYVALLSMSVLAYEVGDDRLALARQQIVAVCTPALGPARAERAGDVSVRVMADHDRYVRGHALRLARQGAPIGRAGVLAVRGWVSPPRWDAVCAGLKQLNEAWQRECTQAVRPGTEAALAAVGRAALDMVDCTSDPTAELHDIGRVLRQWAEVWDLPAVDFQVTGKPGYGPVRVLSCIAAVDA